MKPRRFWIASVILFLVFFDGTQAFSVDPSESPAVPAIFTLLLSQGQEKVTRLIRAGQGGSLNLTGISLSIPPDSLNQDTVITLSSVDVSQYDRQTTTGSVKNLHLSGAVIEPNGIELNIPAVLRFSLPRDWDC